MSHAHTQMLFLKYIIKPSKNTTELSTKPSVITISPQLQQLWRKLFNEIGKQQWLDLHSFKNNTLLLSLMYDHAYDS